MGITGLTVAWNVGRPVPHQNSNQQISSWLNSQVSQNIDCKVQNLRLSHKNIFKPSKKQLKKNDFIIMVERKFAK